MIVFNSIKRNPIALFLCRFLVIFVVLAIPWPGVNKVYGNIFRGLVRIVFTGQTDHRGLSVEAPAADSKQPFDTRIAIVNRALKRADGSVPVRNVDVEFGWQPVALLLALILATPVSWRRRGWAVFWGLLGYHCFLLLSLDFVIWAESAEISLVTLTPFWKFFANEFKDMITGQTSLAVPVVIWMLIIFRREDRGMIFPAKLQTAA